jgi:hypothetical protein
MSPNPLDCHSKRSRATRQACIEFLTVAALFYNVPIPDIRVLAARPLCTREGGWASELFGEYDPETHLIRVWMKTAVRKQVTSFGTFLSTLCHEFCHHPRLSEVQVSGLVAHTRLLRACRSALPSCPRYAAEGPILDQNIWRAMENRLAADQSRLLNGTARTGIRLQSAHSAQAMQNRMQHPCVMPGSASVRYVHTASAYTGPELRYAGRHPRFDVLSPKHTLIA